MTLGKCKICNNELSQNATHKVCKNCWTHYLGSGMAELFCDEYHQHSEKCLRLMTKNEIKNKKKHYWNKEYGEENKNQK